MNEDRRPTAATAPEEPTPRVEDRVAKVMEKNHPGQTADRATENVPREQARDPRNHSD